MSHPVLAITLDPEILEEIRAAAAAAGLDVRTAASVAAAGATWAAAGTVVIGADALAASTGAVHRPGVVVATREELPVALWPAVLGVGAEKVIALPGDRSALVAALGCAPAGAGALVIGVVGGRGGAGASVLTARLAAAFAADGTPVLALDADPDGCGLDVLLALEQEPGARWSRLLALDEALPAQALRGALPGRGPLAVLAHDAQSSAAPSTAPVRLLESARAAYDVVVVDLPRGRSDVLDALVPRCDALLVVVTSDVSGAAAASRILCRLGPEAGARLVVREVPGSDLVADELVGWLGAPVAAELPHDPRLAAAIDHGMEPSPRSRWSRAVRDLARQIAPARRRAA